VQAYWLDLEFGKKKKSPLKPARKRPRKAAQQRREGDYIAGEDGNVFVLRTTYSSEMPLNVPLRQSGNSSNAVLPNLI
jgi:hypothetical protein